MRVTSNLPAARRQLLRRFDDGIQEAADTAAQAIQDGAPVASGDLRDSVEAEPIQALRAGVYIGAFYWIFPNYGTRYMSAQPFVEPGLEEGVRQLKRLRLDR